NIKIHGLKIFSTLCVTGSIFTYAYISDTETYEALTCVYDLPSNIIEIPIDYIRVSTSIFLSFSAYKEDDIKITYDIYTVSKTDFNDQEFVNISNEISNVSLFINNCRDVDGCSIEYILFSIPPEYEDKLTIRIQRMQQLATIKCSNHELEIKPIPISRIGKYVLYDLSITSIRSICVGIDGIDDSDHKMTNVEMLCKKF